MHYLTQYLGPIAMPSDSDEDGDASDNNTRNVSNICKMCSQNVRSSYVKCNRSKCGSVLHVKCFEMVSRVMQVDRSTWKCKSCAVKIYDDNSKLYSELRILKTQNECLLREKHLMEKLLNELEFSSRLVKSKLVDYEAKTSENKEVGANSTYSSALKKIHPLSPALIVKPKNQNVKYADVEKDIKNNCDVVALKVNVNNTKRIKNGVLISCDDDNSLNALKTALNSQIGDNYEFATPSVLNPRIIIYSVQADEITDNLQFINNLIVKNDLMVANRNDCKFVTKFKSRNCVNVVIEINPGLYKQILDKGYLFVGWKKCLVKENLHLVRCFKCNKYGHVIKNCKSKDFVCGKCSGPHNTKECNSENLTCANCTFYNDKNKTNVSVDHAVGSPSCSFHQVKLASLKNIINYNGNNGK